VNHLTDDELVLHYYDEDGPDLVRAERHLETCVDCARAYEGLARTLRAVTPPDVVEAPDDTIAIRRMLLERAGDRESALMASVHAWLTEPRAIALAWLVPVLYPWAAPAIFAGARSGEPLVRGVLVMLALLWACAGPAVAVLVMNGADDRFDRLSSRVRMLGAILATISPSLFMVVARGGRRLDWWYGAIAATTILAVLPWPSPSGSTPRLRRLHRLSSALLGVFILGHIVNQSLGFVSVPSYAAMRGVMQLASEQSVSYVVIVTMVVTQILTGAAIGVEESAGGRGCQASAGRVRLVSGGVPVRPRVQPVPPGAAAAGRASGAGAHAAAVAGNSHVGGLAAVLPARGVGVPAARRTICPARGARVVRGIVCPALVIRRCGGWGDGRRDRRPVVMWNSHSSIEV